jgi:peptide chain release factor 2
VIEVRGDKAYGYLKAEHGVHRLVRLSPYNAKNSRETSFALVEVLPLVEGSDQVTLDEKELRIETFRARGHGGQGVNTTDSAIRITHLPSGLTASCQNERSQLQNKQTALRILQARLQQQHDATMQAELEKTKGVYKQGTWGNQIRSYVLQPYTLVKDHRTDYENSNTQKVLDGELMEFILAFLKQVSGAGKKH